MTKKKMNILIVDDAIFMRKMLSDILKEAGHRIAGEAANGKEAVEMYTKLKPDLVTMDIIMPEMNGIDAVKQIIESDERAVILVVSAMGQQQLVVEAIQAGAKDFVVKPFESARILAAVEKLAR
ncbi:MAG TPA: response regulator [bacterium]|nr:response regulator [Myxococcales bacterium]OQA59039.1 MAG: Chemotaxis protein CheY [bacterium ADurb.Bin270]HPW45703.1 response regulator [bacterium]HQH80425.1 response regulator [bacterium]